MEDRRAIVILVAKVEGRHREGICSPICMIRRCCEYFLGSERRSFPALPKIGVSSAAGGHMTYSSWIHTAGTRTSLADD